MAKTKETKTNAMRILETKKSHTPRTPTNATNL